MNDAETKLVEALRSGKYKQTMNKLRGLHAFEDREYSYCCLGVACEIFGLGKWSGESCFMSVSTSSCTELTEEVREKLNWFNQSGIVVHPITRAQLISKDGHSLTLVRLNDSGFTFNQISDVIHANMILHQGE